MNRFLKPADFLNSSNEPRRAGFEIEFGNISARDTAKALQKKMGGEINEISPFKMILEKSSIGNIKIERDADILLSAKHRTFFEKINPEINHSSILKEIEGGIDKLSSFIVPCEIVTDPLLFEDFIKLDEIVALLTELNVQGTQDSILNAYGLHINPSTPDLTSKTMISYIQAFLLIEEWLIEKSDIDPTRRYLTNFIDPFPQDYCDITLNSDYTPENEQLIADYMQYNPTRNRALDFLPVLCEIDKDLVFEKLNPVEKNLVHSRPAFHYRLPNCKIGDSDWKIADEWNRWWFVEMLASDDNLRMELIKKWQLSRITFSDNPLKVWIETVDNFLSDNFRS
ncbi:amidoligase family protein [Maridesulfovibrio bastinii]|uniref:amidoligase family protein n=1 Tax=Maridesulfovibrio bastinii TaxID=47157 RepID=UPI0004110B25|nr:amidoligase family protein [Maridesulfovibrio bastinii]